MDSIITRLVIFITVTIFLTFVSRRPLRNLHAHGFYRYFAFEGIAGLVLYNQPVWFKHPFSGVQLLSWFFLIVSVILVVNGILLLRQSGGQCDRQATPQNLAFENTQFLVVKGLYRYIRHPMYASLLFLSWGAFLKQIDPLTIAIVAVVTVALFLTAKVEESENVDFWGSDYGDYKLRSKMFIPFVF